MRIKEKITMTKITKLFIAFLLVAGVSFSQTILSTTTLGAAVATPNTTSITLASTSGMLGNGSQNQPQTVLYVDKELMYVTAVGSSTTVTVRRAAGLGAAGRPMVHASGATVYRSEEHTS